MYACVLISVKQRHAEYVPDKLSEQEFWTRFFQSHYFHRDRITLGNDDMFAECAKADDKGIFSLCPHTRMKSCDNFNHMLTCYDASGTVE